MEQSASEAKSTFSHSINSTNPKFNYRAHNSPMRSQINPIHALKSHSLNIYLNIILPPSGLFRLNFPTKIVYSFIVAFKRINTRPISSSVIWWPHHHLVITTINGDSLKCFQSPVITFILGQNILLTFLYPTPLIYVLPLTWETKFHTHIKTGRSTDFRILIITFLDSRGIQRLTTLLPQKRHSLFHRDAKTLHYPVV
jgi:hypothetical protein